MNEKTGSDGIRTWQKHQSRLSSKKRSKTGKVLELKGVSSVRQEKEKYLLKTKIGNRPKEKLTQSSTIDMNHGSRYIFIRMLRKHRLDITFLYIYLISEQGTVVFFANGPNINGKR